MENIGKILIFLGVFVTILGLALTLGSRIPFLDRLPGDFSIRLGQAEVYFPLATGILLSIILTIVLNLLVNLTRR